MFYILITTDKETISGAKISAFEIVKQRLKIGKWPLYKGTNFIDKIQESNECLVYIAGYKKFSQHIISKIKIQKVEILNKEHDYEEKLFDIISTPALKVLEFKPQEINDNKFINIRDEFSSIDFIPNNMKRWGIFFMGGVKRINSKDYYHLSKKLI